MDPFFNHERLDCYTLAVAISRWIRGTPIPETDLRNQALRASSSIVLNIAEGSTSQGRNRKKHFTYAAASAAEVSSILDILDLPSGPEKQIELRRISQMLHRMH